MKITIVGRKVQLRDNFKALVEKKLSRFDRFFDSDAQASVTVSLEKKRQTVEITIKQRGMIYRAESTEMEMNDALDNAISAISSQIRKNKTKLQRAKKVHPEAQFTDDYYDEPDEEYDVVKTKTFFVKTMSQQEAILQMNLLHHEFFIYRDDDTDNFNVVYKRKDGNYGVLIPEIE